MGNINQKKKSESYEILSGQKNKEIYKIIFLLIIPPKASLFTSHNFIEFQKIQSGGERDLQSGIMLLKASQIFLSIINLIYPEN